MIVIVDKKLCDRCGTCIAVCPENALLLTESLSVDTTRCNQCGKCVAICPLAALSLEN